MSTEQSEATLLPTPQVDITQQATTPTPTVGSNPTPHQLVDNPKREKNPKRVAAGKAVAERTRLAREQQKKAAAEAAIIIENNKKAKAKAKATASNLVSTPEPDPATEEETPNKVDNSSLSTTQWIGVISIVVSLIGIYYKREELKAAFSKKSGVSATQLLSTPHQPADINRVDVLQPVRKTQPRGVKHLD